MKIDDAISMHKRIGAMITKEEYLFERDRKAFDAFNALGLEIALVLSDFRCEKCRSKKELSYHHMIERKNKEATSFNKYYAQRYYYRSIVILCQRCHSKLHQIPKNLAGKHLAESTILKIKERYGIPTTPQQEEMLTEEIKNEN